MGEGADQYAELFSTGTSKAHTAHTFRTPLTAAWDHSTANRVETDTHTCTHTHTHTRTHTHKTSCPNISLCPCVTFKKTGMF